MVRLPLLRWHFATERSSHDLAGGTVPGREQNQWWVVGMKLLQREALEAKAVGGASTVKEERKPRPVVSLTERSEPYNRAALHASRLGKGANALRSRDFGERCGREKPRLIVAADS